MPFLTDVDSRAEVKRSRDPLGLVPIWSRFGREVVGNLTTITNNVRGFTTVLLALYFAEVVQESEQCGESTLALFLKFEQLAGYARVLHRGDSPVRGLRRIAVRLSESSKRIRISPSAEDQILSNQKVYGLWGLFIMPSRASALVQPRVQRLTEAARKFVERRYLPLFSRDGVRTIVSLLRRESFVFDLTSRHAALAKSLAEAHKTKLSADEREFYRTHLAWGGEGDTTGGRQRQLSDLLATRATESFGFADLRAVQNQARRRRDCEALVASLERIESLEHLLSPARVAFGYLLTQDSRPVRDVAAAIRKSWKRPPQLDAEAIGGLESVIAAAAGSKTIASKWVGLASSLENGDYESSIRLLVDMNTEVMRLRDGSAPWVGIEAGRLRVRMADEMERLLPREEVENLWRSTFFINSLWSVSREVTAA